MKLIIAVPFFNTAENRRHHCVVRVLKQLRDQAAGTEHQIVAVDNGSTDLRCWEWLSHDTDITAMRTPEPLSISQGVNWAWRLFESELNAGTALACKYDSDMVVSDGGWMDKLAGVVEMHEVQMDEGIPLGMVGLLVQRHPQREDVLASPRLRGGLVRVPYLHGACVVRTPIAWQAIGYERHPFLPKFLPKHADPDLPWGRWGFGDHWTAERVKFCNLWMGILADVNVAGIFGSGSLSRDEKSAIMGVARQSLEELLRQLGTGEIGPYQPYDGPPL